MKGRPNPGARRPRSEAYRRNISAAKKGKKIPALGPAGRRRWAALSLEERKRVVMVMLKGLGGTRLEFLDRLGRVFVMHSKSEVAFARALDRAELTWNYQPAALLLADGRLYVPDFWVQEWGTYVEIKDAHPGHNKGLAKVLLARQAGHAVRVIDGREQLTAEVARLSGGYTVCRHS